jgi:hypothetical protein
MEIDARLQSLSTYSPKPPIKKCPLQAPCTKLPQIETLYF